MGTISLSVSNIDKAANSVVMEAVDVEVVEVVLSGGIEMWCILMACSPSFTAVRRQ